MKIYYIANSRLPTIKAYGLQIVKMCEAFTKAGFDCELVIPKRPHYPGTGDDIIKYYSIKNPFKITKLYSFDLINLDISSSINRFLFWVQQLSFAFSLKKYLPKTPAIIYSRDQFALYLLDNKNYKLIWEAHTLPANIKSRLYSKIFKKIHDLVVISKGLKEEFSKYYSGQIIIAPDGVDLEEFNLKLTKNDARRKLLLPLDKKIAVYSGHLYLWKGVNFLIDSAKYLDDESLILIVGGTKKDIENFKIKIPESLRDKIKLIGHIPHEDVIYYLRAADCAILTAKKDYPISEKYTSPLKLFEYMASGCPIVAQDLPSFREILDDGNSLLVEAENPQTLAKGINKLFNDKDLAENISHKALEEAHKFTWQERVKKIAQILHY